MKEPFDEKPFVSEQYTLADYNKQLSGITNRFAVSAMAEDLMRKDALTDMLAMGYTPPTRWQRFKYRIEDIKQRMNDIWTIVSGGDVHKNCGY